MARTPKPRGNERDCQNMRNVTVPRSDCRVPVAWTIGLVLAAAIACLVSAASAAQPPARRAPAAQRSAGRTEAPARQRRLEVEVLTSPRFSPLKTRQWYELFTRLKVDRLQIRQVRPDDTVGVEEIGEGSGSVVHVRGMVDSQGRFLLPHRTFSQRDPGAIAKWFQELRTYGPKGSPEGLPRWGLSKEQFESLFDALSRPAPVELEGPSLPQVLQHVRASTGLTLAVHPVVEARVARSDTTARRAVSLSGSLIENPKGLSLGTWLAAVLAEHDLVFRPERTPADTVQLLVTSGPNAEDSWPVGWPLQQTPGQAAPALFEIVPVQLRNVSLRQVLEAMEKRIEIPILVDAAGLARKDVDALQTRVEYPPKRVAWSLVLSRVLFKARLQHELRADEAGNPLVWITTLESPRARAKAEKD